MYPKRFYRISRGFCRIAGGIMFRPHVVGLANVPQEGGALLLCNHQSYLDPVVAAMPIAREVHFMARDTLFRPAWFAAMLRSYNVFPVKRGAADVGAIKEALRRARSGRLLMLFPEGTRTEDGRIGEFMPGLAAIASKTRVPIIPTLVDGVFQVWPRSQKLPRPGRIVVEYGTPIPPEAYAELNLESLTRRIRDQLIAMQKKWHERMPRLQLKWDHESHHD